MGDAFALQMNPLELVLRGTAVYWALFLLFRFLLRRDAGSLGIADILLLVLIADASQNAMAGGYDSVGDGLVLIATIAGWNCRRWTGKPCAAAMSTSCAHWVGERRRSRASSHR